MARKKGRQIPLRRKQSFLPQQLQHLRPLDFLHHCQVGWYKLNLRLPHRLVGKAIPDYNICDLVVYRQAPVVATSDGMVMNNFSGMGHYIELIPAAQVLNDIQAFGGTTNSSANGTASGTANATNTTTVVAFGEFALLDPEVVPVNEVLDKYNWTVTTIHNHMLDESPKLLFMH
jgi:hypothetical protein